LHYEGTLAHASFPYRKNIRELTKTTTLQPKGKITRAYLLYRTSTSAFPRNTLHLEKILAHANFPSSTRTSALPKTTLHRQGNLTHDIILSIRKGISRTISSSIHHQRKMTHASFPSFMKENTSALPKTIKLHHEGKLACANFPYST
jgi:hypothetical protein